MRTPEGHEKADIDKMLKSIAGLWYCAPVIQGFGKSGMPDRIGCYQGMLFALEVKRPGKAPTALQLIRMREIQDAGGFVLAGTAADIISRFEQWIRQRD